MTASTLISKSANSSDFQFEMSKFTAILQYVAKIAYGAVEAIVKNDVVSARCLVDQLRGQNIDVAELRESLDKNFPGFEPRDSDKQIIVCALNIFREAESVVNEWMDGNGRAIGEGFFVSPDEYWNRNIDLLLPKLWSFDSDIFVVRGKFDLVLFNSLKSRGQKRILFVGFNRSEYDDMVDISDCSFVEGLEDLPVYIDSLKAPLPFRFSYLILASDCADVASVESFKAVLEKSVMTLWMDLNTRKSYSRRWIDQAVRNIPLVIKGKDLAELDGRFNGRPAILVAPGPSLEKNIHLLKSVRGRAIVIAQLQAVRRLYKEGVRPDFIVVLDPQDLTGSPFNCLDEVPDDFLTTLIVAVTCHPSVIRRFKNVFYYDGGSGVEGWLQPYLSNTLADLSGATTAITCIRLALHWKCSPVVMVGQDLSVADGKRYAGSGPETMLPVGMRKLPGYFGGLVESPSNYFLFHFALESLVDGLRRDNPGVELFNCTEGGAYINGFDHLPLRDVIDKRIAKRNLVADWAESSPAMDESIILSRASVVRDQLLLMIDAVDIVLLKIESCRQLLKGECSSPEMLSRLNIEEGQVKYYLKNVSIFSMIFEGEILDIVRRSGDAKTLADSLLVSEDLYELIQLGCVGLRSSLIDAHHCLDQSC